MKTMALYINQTGKLKEVKEKPFKLEKDIQKVFEANLPVMMGLELVKSEFTIKSKRIDTLVCLQPTGNFPVLR